MDFEKKMVMGSPRKVMEFQMGEVVWTLYDTSAQVIWVSDITLKRRKYLTRMTMIYCVSSGVLRLWDCFVANYKAKQNE